MTSIPTRRDRFAVDDRLIRLCSPITFATTTGHHIGAGDGLRTVRAPFIDVRSGQWRRLSPGVYFVDDREFTAAARVRAGVWGYGESATASGTAAAWWHGLLTEPPEIVEVTVARTATGRARDGIRLRRRNLFPADVVNVRDLQVTALALTVVETAPGRRWTEGDGPCAANAGRAHVRNKGPLRITSCPDHAAGRRRQHPFEPNAGWSADAPGSAPRLVCNHPVGPYLVDNAFPKPRWRRGSTAAHSTVTRRSSNTTGREQNHLILNGWRVAIHLAGPLRAPRTRDRRDPTRDFGALTVGQRRKCTEITGTDPQGAGFRCVGCCASTPSAATSTVAKRQQFLEQHPQFEPGQVGAQA